MAGVHATEQGLDQPVHDLVAEPGRHQLADRDVLVVGEGCAGPLVAQPLDTGVAEHTGRRDLVDVGGDAHHRTGQRAERPTGPDG